MRFLKGLFVFLIIIQSLSCSRDTRTTDIDGHWHTYSEDSPFKTLDIKDSVVSPNKFNLINANGFDFDFSPLDVDIKIKGNTLQMDGDGVSYKYVKSELENCILTDRYYEVVVNISLTKGESSKSYDSICKNYSCLNLFIGKLRKNSTPHINKLRSTFPDSIFIQAYDGLISLNEIRAYAVQLHTHINDPYGNVNLHIDDDVPMEFINKVLKSLEGANVLISDVVASPNGDIGLLLKK